jgi:ribose transport system permease protein
MTSTPPRVQPTPVTPDVESDDLRAVAPRPWPVRWVTSGGNWVLVLDLLLVVLFTVLSTNNVFFSSANFQALMLGGAEGLLLALGLAMLMGAGFFDLSLGANLVLSSVVGAAIVRHIAGATPNAAGNFRNVGLAMVLGLLGCLATGFVYGLVNGLIIAYLDVNSLIATLGTLGIGTGIAYVITNGGDIGGLPPKLQSSFGIAAVAGVPLPALVGLVLAVVCWAVLTYTRFGTRTLAIGSLRAAAERAGIRVKPHIVMLALIAGTLAGLAGFVDIARFGTTTVAGHAEDGLAAVTAVVIGGTLLEGGRVSIPGAVWGTGLAIILSDGLVVLGVAPFYQLIVIGVVLVAAVALDRLRYRREPH